ncbi:MAG: ATP-binding cassette domain-containing protein [Pirellulaceae bacterium]|nr:ATP-binding cassette domain-containing protein [Pirellulaceae bacterium]
MANGENSEHLVWAIRSIANHYGSTVDMQRLRHLSVEIDALPTVESLCENLGPIARHFGYRVSQLQANRHDVQSLLAEGLPVLLFREQKPDLVPIVLLKYSRGRYLVNDYGLGKTKWLSAAEAGLDSPADERDLERHFQIYLAQQVASVNEASAAGDFPLLWLWRFLKHERPDFRVLLLFGSVVSVLALATPITVEALVNTVAFGRYFQPILVLSLILFVLLSFRAALIAISSWIVEIIQRRLFVRVVSDLTFRLPKLRPSIHDQNYVPELVNRFFDVVIVQKAAAVFLLEGINVTLQVVIGMAVLAFYHPALLGYDLVLLFFLTFYLYFIGRGAIRTSIQESKYKYKNAAWLEEIVRSPNAFRRNSGQNLAENRSDEFAQGYITAREAHFRILIRQIVSTLAIQAIAATALLALGGWLVIQGSLTLGQLVAAELIVTGILSSVAKFGKHIELYYDMMAAADKLRQLLELPIIDDGYYPPADDRCLGEIKTENVKFSFGSRELSFPDFQVRSGESLAVVGGEGSGKSLLLQMLVGLRMPTSGQIRFGGVGSHELNFSLIECEIGYAAGIEIIKGTIAENVHLDRENVRSADVRHALETVGLLADVDKLANGIDTELECLGQPLTESQSLRLMLARAIVERPRLLIIDGTLDRLSDAALPKLIEQLAIASSPSLWTTIIATGRNPVIAACQHVVDLDRLESNASTWEAR